MINIYFEGSPIICNMYFPENFPFFLTIFCLRQLKNINQFSGYIL